jgi:hypothetical protein
MAAGAMYVARTQRRTRKAILAVLIAATAALAQVPQHADAQAVEPTPATVSVDFGAEQGDLRRTERFNTWDNGDPRPALRAGDVAFLNAQGLHADLVRVGFGVNSSLCNVATQTCDFSPVGWIDDVSNLTDALVVHMTPTGVFRPDGASGDPAQALPLLTLAIRELKKRLPNVENIEAFNEPEFGNHINQARQGLPPRLLPDDLYRWYVPFYQAVNAVNAELAPAVPIKIGGPTLMSFDHEEWMPAFLDDYVADPNPDKRLDFVSWHGYGYFDKNNNYAFNFYKDNPSVLATQRARLDAMLQERGLSTQIPAFITETGIYPGPSFDEPNPSTNDWVRQAAGLASLHYWWSDQPNTFPFNWVVRHTSEGRKDQLITLRGPGEVTPPDTFTPYGNMLKMQTMMKVTQVSATSDSLANGKGVYARASKDESGASVMVWNYQGIGTTTHRATVDLSNLPSNLSNQPVRMTLFRIDQTTSNYFNDPNDHVLRQVGAKTILPTTSHTETLDLPPNGIYLALLAPLTRENCVSDGWQQYTDDLGNPFRNQGDCVSYVATRGKKKAKG